MKEEMKDSGIEWIGLVPKDWNLLRMKDCSYMKGRIGWQGLTADEFIDRGPYLITGTDFENGRVVWDRCYHISEKRYEEAIPIQIKEGDLLVTKDGTIGKLAYIDYLPDKASLNSHLLVIRPLRNKYINRFLFWVLSSTVFKGYYSLVSYGSTMDSLSQEKVGEFRFFVPTATEQKLIANFLDERCKRIDGIVADLENQIDVMNKYKIALINEKVTKGLKDNVEFQDSRVSWIGEIPNTWDVKRIIHLLKMPITDGPHITPDMYDDGIPFVSAEAVSTGDGKINFDNIWGYISKEFYNECCRKYKPELNDIYMIKSGATTGKVAIVDQDRIFNIWSPLAVFRVDSSIILPKFMFYSLQADFFQTQVQIGWTYGTQQNISMRTLEHLKICLPPMNEQIEIADYLDEKVTVINEIINKKQLQLEKIKSNKSSLIYEYVTGKKRVKVGE